MATNVKDSVKLGLLMATLISCIACGHRGDLERPPPLWGKSETSQSQGSDDLQTESKQDEDDEKN